MQIVFCYNLKILCILHGEVFVMSYVYVTFGKVFTFSTLTSAEEANGNEHCYGHGHVIRYYAICRFCFDGRNQLNIEVG